MMRTHFEQEMHQLNLDMIHMGSLVESAIEKAVQALIHQDVNLAKEAIGYDAAVDDMERVIERRCLKLLLQHQPVARDLRKISAALKMITDMERIGDQSADISELTERMVGQDYIKELIHIPQMADATMKMVRESIDAFVKNDTMIAQAVIDYDDIVDNLFNIVKGDLIDIMVKDKSMGEQAVDLIMIAKYFERIGDHAVNIAEWVIFSITGQHKDRQVM
jgi:phosphate transport system protein